MSVKVGRVDATLNRGLAILSAEVPRRWVNSDCWVAEFRECQDKILYNTNRMDVTLTLT